MMMQQTLTQLRTLKLDGFADGLEEQLAQPGSAKLSFEERLSLLVDRETHWRDDRRRTRLLKHARLKYPQALIEDLDTRSGRGIDARALTSLALGDWVQSGYSLLISGPTGGRQIVARVCVGAVRLPAWALGAVSACAEVDRRTENPARQRRLHEVAHASRAR
ncbi:DNA replication protein DnaC [Paraburkholderia sp. WC7.3g]